MVRKSTPLNKSAFTMIELIFAIVIIGISMLSLPMMTQVTSKSIEGSFAQEAIFLASAELNQALSYQWNGNSQETFGGLSKVLFAPAAYRTCDATTKQRPGHVHRMCLNDASQDANLTAGVDVADEKDFSLNNAATTNENLTINNTGTTGSSTGYKSAYTMDVDVDFANLGTITKAEKNIKEIIITVKKDGSPYVVLRTYSSNIGEVQAFKRTF